MSDETERLRPQIHLILHPGAVNPKLAPDYAGDDVLALDALATYRKRGVATGVYFGDLAAAMDPAKEEPFDCHLYRDRKHHKITDVHVVCSGPTLGLAVCRALVAMEAERKKAEAW